MSDADRWMFALIAVQTVLSRKALPLGHFQSVTSSLEPQIDATLP
jgi:hypothetical protein